MSASRQRSRSPRGKSCDAGSSRVGPVDVPVECGVVAASVDLLGENVYRLKSTIDRFTRRIADVRRHEFLQRQLDAEDDSESNWSETDILDPRPSRKELEGDYVLKIRALFKVVERRTDPLQHSPFKVPRTDQRYMEIMSDMRSAQILIGPSEPNGPLFLGVGGKRLESYLQMLEEALDNLRDLAAVVEDALIERQGA